VKISNRSFNPADAESNQQIDAVVPFTALAELHNSGSTALQNDWELRFAPLLDIDGATSFSVL